MTTVLGVFAHPDDETYRCGGTLALLARQGVRVRIVTATPGQAGSCGDPPLCSQDELGAVRTAELHCACQALGIEPPTVWDYVDGSLATVDDESAVERLLALVQQEQPELLLTWPPHGLSGHADHQAVSRWATRAFAGARDQMPHPMALYYIAVPQSMADALGMHQIQAQPDDEIDAAIDVMPVWDAKTSAIRCHRTQRAESPILREPEARQGLFLATEHFQRATSSPAHRLIEA